jgi:hypothetical protein
MRLIFAFVVGCALIAPLTAHAELRGVMLYERGDYARARQVLEKELRSPNLSAEERIKARLYLAAALHASGAEAAARVQLEELAVTAPTLQVDPILFPASFVAMADSVRKEVEASRQRQQAEQQRLEEERKRLEAERQRLEQERLQAAKPPPPKQQVAQEAEHTRTQSVLRLSPELFGFTDALGKSVGAGGGLTLGLGSLELGARVLVGDQLGIGAEAGLLLGSGTLRPRVGLRGTAVPGASSFGGGAVVGLRIRAASRLTFLVDVGAELFSAPRHYRAFALTGSAGISFNVL